MAKTIKVQVVFGSEAVNTLVNDRKVDDDVLHGFNEYEFPTQAEADAFLQGVEAACGWMEYHLPEVGELRKIRRKQSAQKKAAANG